MKSKMECANCGLAGGMLQVFDDGTAMHFRPSLCLARLRAIVDKLLKTADGVPITPGMEIWHLRAGDCVLSTVLGMFRLSGTWWLSVESGPKITPSDCWSAIEAAEAAGAKCRQKPGTTI